jgi:hypothetical protein
MGGIHQPACLAAAAAAAWPAVVMVVVCSVAIAVVSARRTRLLLLLMGMVRVFMVVGRVMRVRVMVVVVVMLLIHLPCQPLQEVPVAAAAAGVLEPGRHLGVTTGVTPQQRGAGEGRAVLLGGGVFSDALQSARERYACAAKHTWHGKPRSTNSTVHDV